MENVVYNYVYQYTSNKSWEKGVSKEPWKKHLLITGATQVKLHPWEQHFSSFGQDKSSEHSLIQELLFLLESLLLNTTGHIPTLPPKINLN